MFSKSLLVISSISLLLGFYAAINGTNDCDLGDTVLVIGLPGFISMVVAVGLISGKIRFSLKTLIWIWVLALLAGFVILGAERSHLNKTAVGDCQ